MGHTSIISCCLNPSYKIRRTGIFMTSFHFLRRFSTCETAFYLSRNRKLLLTLLSNSISSFTTFIVSIECVITTGESYIFLTHIASNFPYNTILQQAHCSFQGSYNIFKLFGSIIIGSRGSNCASEQYFSCSFMKVPNLYYVSPTLRVNCENIYSRHGVCVGNYRVEDYAFSE